MAEEETEGEILQDTLFLYECPEHGLFVDFSEPGSCPICGKDGLQPLDKTEILTIIQIEKQSKKIEALSLKR